jgi:UDP-glucuronate decarboxylase
MAVDDGRVVSNFIVQALTNQDITVYGDGNQVRSFCYVSDLIEGLERRFFAPDYGTPINLGNPTPITILELANEIIHLTGSKSHIRNEALPLDDPITREPDITKAIGHLGWKPKVPRQEGLEQTIEYFKKLLVL